MSLRTTKARNCLFSQRLGEDNAAVPISQPRFRAAVPIWGGNRGDSRVKSPNPHKFLCSTCSKASLLQALQRAGWAGPPLVGDRIPDLDALARDLPQVICGYLRS